MIYDIEPAKLKAMRKDDILKSIEKEAWSYRSLNDRLANLEKELKIAQAPHNQAKLMVCGAAGIDLPLDDYSKAPKLDEVDLCYVIGVLISKFCIAKS